MSAFNSIEEAEQALQALEGMRERLLRTRSLSNQVRTLLGALRQNLKGARGRLLIQVIPALLSPRKRNHLMQLPEAFTELQSWIDGLAADDQSVWTPLITVLEKGLGELRGPRSDWRRLLLVIDVEIDHAEQILAQRRESLSSLIVKYGTLPVFKRVLYMDQNIFDVRKSVETEGAQVKASPKSARKLASFLIPASRQDEVIGDITELYHGEWLPLLGPTGARCCSVWNVITASVALRRIAITAAVVDGFFRILGR